MLTYLQTSIKFDKTEKTKKNALVYKQIYQKGERARLINARNILTM